MFSCSKDSDNDNNLAGTYSVSQIILENCDPSSINIVVNFNNQDCVTQNDYIHCRSGKLILNRDNTFTSTISTTRGSVSLGFSLPFFSLNKQGNYQVSNTTMNLCVGNDCDDFTISNDKLSYTYSSLGCTNTIVLKKE